jgi:hypothetical protein
MEGSNYQRGAKRGKGPPNPRHEALCRGLHCTGGWWQHCCQRSLGGTKGAVPVVIYFSIARGVFTKNTRNKIPIKSRDAELSCWAGRSQFGMVAGTVLAANRRTLTTEHQSRINGHKTSQKCKFIQINLHHITAELAILYRTLAIRELDIAAIQEPCVYRDWIRGHCVVPLLDPAWLSGTRFVPCHWQSSALGLWQWRGTCYVSTPPLRFRQTTLSNGLREVTDYSGGNKSQLIIACDAKTQHLFGETDWWNMWLAQLAIGWRLQTWHCAWWWLTGTQ